MPAGLDALIAMIERLYPASDLQPPLLQPAQTYQQPDIDTVAGFMRGYNAANRYA